MFESTTKVKKEDQLARDMQSGIEAAERELGGMHQKLEALQAEKEKKSLEKQDKLNKIDDLAKERERLDGYAEQLKKQGIVLEQRRKALHNVEMELKGNIRVFCRVRPALSTEGHELTPMTLNEEQTKLSLSSDQLSVDGLKSQTNTWDFNFDSIFGPNSTQETVFDEISQLVQSALDGYKVFIRFSTSKNLKRKI